MTVANRKMTILPAEGDSAQVRNRLETVNRGVTVLNPRDKLGSDYAEEFGKRRVPYATMRAHQELAAQALATGATLKMAAKYAGVNPRQIKKYYTQVDFRERVEELRSVMLSRLKGRIVRDLMRRTSAEAIKQLELLDILRIGDRVGLARGAAVDEKAGNVQHNTYEQIFNTLVLPHAGAQGGDFPVYELNDTSVPDPDSPE